MMATIDNTTISNTKVCFIGNQGTNKSEIAKELFMSNKKDLRNDYFSVRGGKIYLYYLSSDRFYTIVDCNGDPKYNRKCECLCCGCNFFVIFTDDNHQNSDLSLAEWKTKALNISPNATIHHVHNAKLQDVRAILV